ncbi:MAG: LysM peptidoglycan-binding domain-containing protein [Planctomycetia bacterium]|nr:LysM peptidoglycan-binding domain-containing protein [Planctomycetia bacterium]
MSHRWKIAVVGAILAAGAGAALLFRKDGGQGAGAVQAANYRAPENSEEKGTLAASHPVRGAVALTPAREAASANRGNGDTAGSSHWSDAAPPTAEGPSRSPAAAKSVLVQERIVTHRIVDGDTLARLAERYLGSASRADEIFRQNQQVLPAADLLPVGKVLRIAVTSAP